MSAQYRIDRPPLSRGVIIVWVVLVAGWLARVLVEPLRAVMDAHVAISSANLDAWSLWTPLTYWAFEADVFPLVLHGALAYLFGADVEARKGAKTFWGTMAAGAALGGLVAAAFTWGATLAGATLPPILGFDAAISALVAAYCWMYWDREMRFFTFELDGKVLLAGFATLNAVFAIITLHPGVLGMHLGGYAAGLLVGSGMQAPKQLRKHFHYWRVRRRMKIVARTPEDDDVAAGRKKKNGEWIN